MSHSRVAESWEGWAEKQKNSSCSMKLKNDKTHSQQRTHDGIEFDIFCLRSFHISLFSKREMKRMKKKKIKMIIRSSKDI